MDKKIDPQGFEALLVKAFKMTTEEVAGLYNDAGELTDFALITQKDTDRIAKIKTDSENQQKRAFKEGAEKLEKAIKDKYEVESDLIGVELFDHIIETRLADVKNPEGDIMKNPDVIKLISQHAKEKKQWDKELQVKLEAKEKEISDAILFKEIESIGLAEFDKLRPILPTDPLKAQRQKNDLLVSELKKYKYQKDGESPVVLKQDGTTLMDEHGYPVTFSNHIKTIAEKSFEFKTAEDRSSSGNNNQTSGTGSKVRKPKDKDDYVLMMRDNTLTSADRVAIMKLATEAKIV
jgi:hypothetical protein